MLYLYQRTLCRGGFRWDCSLTEEAVAAKVVGSRNIIDINFMPMCHHMYVGAKLLGKNANQLRN